MKLNKYERIVMLRLYFIKYLIILSSILNLVLPIYSKGLGYTSPLQYIVIITHIIGYQYANGYLEGQKLLIIPVFTVRIIQILLHGLLGWNPINLLFDIIVVLLDVLIIFLKFIDKLRIYYEVEKVEE